MGYGNTKSSGGSSGYGGKGTSAKPHHSSLLGKILGGPGKFVTNLGSDVKDAVVGLPAGLVVTAEHPERAGKAMLKQTWHDWAPLIKGHPIQFAKQSFDHPLAPLLDIATVFSAGAAGAARVGAGLEAAGAEGSLAAKAASLGRGSTRMVRDVKGAEAGTEAKPLLKTYSSSPGANLRRHMANRALVTLEPHLPAWFKQTARESRMYSRLQHVEDAHKLAAKGGQVKALMAAGKAVSDPSLQHIIQPAILSHNYANFVWHASEKAPVDAAAHVPEFALAPGERYVLSGRHAEAKLKFNPKVSDLATRMDRFGNDFTTKDVKLAEHRNGKPLVIRTDAVKAQATEGANSTRFLRKLAHNPTMLWKRINVGYAPRVVTNNAVGNWLMYAMRTTGDHGARGFVDAVKYAHGERAALRSFKDMHAHVVSTQGAEAGAKFTALAHPSLYDYSAFDHELGKVGSQSSDAMIRKTFGDRAADAVKRPPHWQTQFFGDELNNTFGHAVLGDAKAEDGKLATIRKQGFYPLVHRVADHPVRVASLYSFMRGAPEVKAFLKDNPGVTLDAAIHKVLSSGTDSARALRERAVQHVRSIAGDYTSIGPHERMLQNILPFYLWDKHIVKHLGNMVSEKPGRVAVMQNLSRYGDEESKKLLGELPSFMQGALPLSLLGMSNHNGRTPLIVPSGLNPYSTAGDLGKLVSSITTNPNPSDMAEAAGNLSPVLSGIVEQLSGSKLGSQAPVERHGGLIPSVLANTALGTSYGTLIQRALGERAKAAAGNETLYQGTPAESVAGLFGLPVKEASLARAAQLAAKENPKKKKRKVGYGGGK